MPGLPCPEPNGKGYRTPSGGAPIPKQGSWTPSRASPIPSRGSRTPKGGYPHPLRCPKVGHRRVGAGQWRVSGYPFSPQIGASSDHGDPREGIRPPFHAPAWSMEGARRGIAGCNTHPGGGSCQRAGRRGELRGCGAGGHAFFLAADGPSSGHASLASRRQVSPQGVTRHPAAKPAPLSPAASSPGAAGRPRRKPHPPARNRNACKNPTHGSGR